MEVIMGHCTQGECPVCGADIWDDQNSFSYIETKEGKVYLCAVCGPGFAEILSMLGIAVTINEVPIGKLREAEVKRE